ncbi:Stp1/IreP family PP2C-type Ser/Thr phosphatase [Methylotenera sp.]|uniref:Stp1/IreP family PP2C-type Ser/Thr phosphatase n=1 Tax=Methylotenera sp. TaxID=2051956 RepID=UPI002731231E|nr:Stp1/IreP family PP2C-type Ser/Thr phosphatase [Methylotenera sp.]MDP2230030.1 Stp1/IreP family PP2C-type Ser/Thr phosphatase [Methylotenera sp.]MDP3140089.1 Stp1/IreP family PP2C-type Ser/Thr phosphatase [Methylotenera sp.]
MNLSGVLEIVRVTDVGLHREHNEDAIASDDTMGFVVLADGMGGYKAGEVASEIAVLSITAELKEALAKQHPGKVDLALGQQAEAQLIINAVKSANEVIYSVSQTQPQCAGMGATLVVGLFTNNKLLVGHIGDSRMYRLRNQVLSQITEDHSVLQEQIRLGLITPEQAKYSTNKNLVTRALGVDPEVELELNEHNVEINDIYLICSDGLSDLVEDEVIESVLNDLSSNIENAAHTLVQLANDNGGSDNISVILIKVNASFEYKETWLDRVGVDNFLGWLK